MAGKRKRKSDESNEEEPSQQKSQSEEVSEEATNNDGEEEEEPKEEKKKAKKGGKKASTKKGEKATASKKKGTTKGASSSAKGCKKASASASSKAKSKVQVIKSEPEAKKMIIEYMQKQNRPYSLQQIIDNLGGQIKKAMATKCVDKLEQSNELVCKTNGKQKIYFRTQEGLEVLSKEALKEIDTEIRTLQNEFNSHKNENTTLTNTLTKIQKSLSNVELEECIQKEEQILLARKEKLEKLQNGQVQLVAPEEKQKALKEMDQYLKEWKKRKVIAAELVDNLSEGTGQKPGELFEEIGVDTDEIVGVDCKTMGKLIH
ncbi:hypothetical protein ABK040_011109 [Willaertia magna]